MKFKNEIFQILSSAFLIAALFMAFAWICIHYQTPQESLKEAISLTVSFMGVIATVVTALVAVLLFNDWKEQQSHQNIMHFGLEVYTNFKKFDEIFKIIIEELIILNFKMETVKGNKEVIQKLVKDSTKLYEYSNQASSLFGIFHDSVINYCIVTKQEIIINNDLPKTCESFEKFIKILTKVKYSKTIPEVEECMSFLLSDPVKYIHTYIYNYYIKSILLRIRIS